MPIYEYQCEECKNNFEMLRHFLDNEEIKCPECKSGKVQRILSKFSCGNSSFGASGCNSSISA